MKKFWLILLIALPLVISTAWHKYYFSVTQVDYDSKSQSLQIITRIFYDDLQRALQERYDPEIEVDETYDQDKLNQFIKRYISQKFFVKINGEDQEINYLGHEDDNDYVVCYIEVKNVHDISSVSIENTLLMDVFPDQKNVVHIHVGDNKKSFLLISGNDKAVLNFAN